MTVFTLFKGFTSVLAYASVNTNIPSTRQYLDRVISKSWLPICRVTQVPLHKKNPLQVKSMDRKLSVVQTLSGFQVFDDACPHRRACLSSGLLKTKGTENVKKTSIVCPYHGMEFDVDSGSVDSFLGTKYTNKKTRLTKYPVIVHDGLVWTNLSERPGEFKVGSIDPVEKQKEGVSIYGSVDIKTSLFELEENHIDTVHVHMVHRFGNSMDPSPTNVVKVPTGRGMYFDYNSGARSRSFANIWKNDKNEKNTVQVYNAFSEPLSSMSRVSFGKNFENVKTIRVNLLPIDENTTRMHWVVHRNFAKSRIFDGIVRYLMVDTIKEDEWILDRTMDLLESHEQRLTGFDWLVSQYREKMIDYLS